MRILIFIASLWMAGCESYQFGDATRTVFKFRQHYCSLPDDLKEAAHEKAKEILGQYPDASWCEGVGFVVDVIEEI